MVFEALRGAPCPPRVMFKPRTGTACADALGAGLGSCGDRWKLCPAQAGTCEESLPEFRLRQFFHHLFFRGHRRRALTDRKEPRT